MDPLAQVSSIASLIIAISAAFIAWKKTKPEGRKVDADTYETMQDTLDKSIETIGKLQGRLSDVEKRTEILLAEAKAKNIVIDDITKVNEKILAENNEIRAENRRLERYIRLCVLEIQRVGGVVPPMPQVETD